MSLEKRFMEQTEIRRAYIYTRKPSGNSEHVTVKDRFSVNGV